MPFGRVLQRDSNTAEMGNFDRPGEGVSQGHVASQPLQLCQKMPIPLIIKSDWLKRGIISVPPRFANFLAGTNTIHLLYDDVDDLLPYEQTSGEIEGADIFYSAKGVSAGDKIYLQLQSIDPTRLLIQFS